MKKKPKLSKTNGFSKFFYFLSDLMLSFERSNRAYKVIYNNEKTTLEVFDKSGNKVCEAYTEMTDQSRKLGEAGKLRISWEKPDDFDIFLNYQTHFKQGDDLICVRNGMEVKYFHIDVFPSIRLRHLDKMDELTAEGHKAFEEFLMTIPAF